MNHSLRARQQQHGHPSPSPHAVARPHLRQLRVRQSGDGATSATPDRITCSICGFPGISIATVPGENFPTTYTTTGMTYVWASPADAITSLDKQVLPVPNPAVSCAFCGGTQFLSGSKGAGQ
jgi:hypothetical protein